MSSEEILNFPANFYFIQRGWLNSNSLVITGERPTVIDTGYFSHEQETLRRVGQHLDPAQLKLILNTHFHSDHVGANARLQSLSGAPIALHEVEAHYVNLGDKWANWLEPSNMECPEYRVDIALKEGDLIELDGFDLEVIHVPGHSPGGMAFYCRKYRFLISGDALWEGDFGIVPSILEGGLAIFNARDSVRKLTHYDVQQVYPGHGPLITRPKEAMQAALERANTLIADPLKLADHCLRRMAVFELMRLDGCEADFFYQDFTQSYLFTEYNRRLYQLDFAQLYQRLINPLLKRGAILQTNSRLEAVGDR